MFFTPDLEVEAHRKLNLAHVGTALKARNLSVVAALAVNAVVRPVVCTERVYGVIEDVEEVRTELRRESLVDSKLLHHRQIGVEARWSVE